MLEREHELAEIDALLSAAVAGTGRLLVVAGEAGIGKSTLLRAAASRAAERGVRVLTASGGALETEFAFGVARQLFGDAGDLSGRGGGRGAGPRAAAPVGTRALDAGQRAVSFELQHGLYWLTADLAESAPLLVCVDDVQWADPDSLGFLAYLARRLDDLPVALLVAVREGEPCPAPEVLAALRAGGRELTPAALSEAAVRGWVGDAELAAACHRGERRQPVPARRAAGRARAGPGRRAGPVRRPGGRPAQRAAAAGAARAGGDRARAGGRDPRARRPARHRRGAGGARRAGGARAPPTR